MGLLLIIDVLSFKLFSDENWVYYFGEGGEQVLALNERVLCFRVVCPQQRNFSPCKADCTKLDHFRVGLTHTYLILLTMFVEGVLSYF